MKVNRRVWLNPKPMLSDFLALKGMGDEFLKAYIKLAEGEKDPRNLMLVFAIDRVICIEFDISRQYEVC